MAPPLFDRRLIAANLARRPPDRDDFVTPLVRDDLAERLLAVTRRFERAAILSPDATAMPEVGTTAEGPFTFQRISTVLGADLYPGALVLPRRDYDLIVSILDLQIVDDVPGSLAALRQHLVPDGLFLAATLGGDTLSELRHAMLAAESALHGSAHARVAPFMQLADAGRLLQAAGFALPVTDVETHLVRYPDAIALMREVKALGAANPLATRPTRMMSRGLLTAAAAAYGANAAAPDGRIGATLEIIWMSGWAPHESQQKPLRPGSAEVSLTKVLGRSERR